MQKILSVFMCLNIFFSTNVFAGNSHKVAYEIECVEKLKECGIISKEADWDKDDLILRRDIFNYIFYVKSLNTMHPTYVSDDLEEQKEWVNTELTYMKEKLPEGIDSSVVNKFFIGHEDGFGYDDIPEDSQDYGFAFTMYFASLLRGKSIDGKRYACLDDYATYGDAINTVCRLFTNIRGENAECMIVEKAEKEGLDKGLALYYYAEKINLINTDILSDPCCPRVSIEQLNDKITAYEFFVLLNRALYIPSLSASDWTRVCNFHYIDNFADYSPFE